MCRRVPALRSRELCEAERGARVRHDLGRRVVDEALALEPAFEVLVEGVAVAAQRAPSAGCPPAGTRGAGRRAATRLRRRTGARAARPFAGRDGRTVRCSPTRSGSRVSQRCGPTRARPARARLQGLDERRDRLVHRCCHADGPGGARDRAVDHVDLAATSGPQVEQQGRAGVPGSGGRMRARRRPDRRTAARSRGPARPRTPRRRTGTRPTTRAGRPSPRRSSGRGERTSR